MFMENIITTGRLCFARAVVFRCFYLYAPYFKFFLATAFEFFSVCRSTNQILFSAVSLAWLSNDAVRLLVIC